MGTGLAEGIGTPDWRLFLGASISPGGPSDRDEDGLLDADDECPTDPEDRDNFEDLDGCPDPDNDDDTIRDVNDDCPMQPEDFDGFEDTNGCPDPDNDNDGLLDITDACPMSPEDVDGFEDENGCPDPDNDQDGVLDVDDACPMHPEDRDDFEDADGCPDPDNDQDLVLDVDDLCQLEPEDIDGFEDADGCPEEGEGLVSLNCESIDIRQNVYFETNSDVIQARSFPLLDQIAAVLERATYIRLARVDGHTDSRGSDAYNLDLSERRAASVYTYLLQAGISPERLSSSGFGETVPIASNDTRDGRQANRRVEFLIIEQDRTCSE